MLKILKNTKKSMATLILWLMSFNIFGAVLELDSTANQNAFLDKAPNGVPLVNISIPSARGVSVNTFKEFNVGVEGLEILNNAGTGRGYLSGLVVTNPNLTVGKEARTVVFQVNGNNRSEIEGYISALSPHKINLFIANENGIFANGAGFINVDRAVLTTGKVNLKDGDVISFTVNDGNIEIGENGLDVSNVNRVDLISRTQELTGKIVADKELNMVLGQNEVDLQGLVTKTSTVSTNKPALSLNAGVLGSMYANGQINVISTEDGVGVNLKSSVVSEEELRLKLAGNLTQNEMASKNIQIEVKDIESNKILANNLNISADNLQNNKSIEATSANINLNNTLKNDGEIVSNTLNLEAKNNFVNNGKVSVDVEDMKVSQNFENNGEVLGNTVVLSSNNLTNNNKIEIGKATISVSETILNNGELRNNNLELTTKNLNNTGKIENNDLLASVTEKVDNKGQILSNNLTLNASDLENTNEISVGAANITVSNTVKNDGNINGNSLEINSNKLENNKSISASSTKITIAEDLINNDIISGDNVELNSKNIVNNNGSVMFASKNLKINANNTITNDRAEILSQGDIVLNADKIDNKVAKINGLGTVYITARELNNVGEVTDLDKYSLYWETWDGRRLNSYQEVLQKWGNGKLYDSHPDDPDDKVNDILEMAKVHGATTGYSYLFREKMDDIKVIMWRDYGVFTANSTKYPVVPLENKIESHAKTEYATISGGNVVIKTSELTNNTDGIISSSGITQIESPKIVNKVSIDENNPIAMRDGEETLSWDRNKNKLTGHVSYPMEYQRIIKNNGVSYNAGQPSIIEGNTLIIDTNNIVGEKYTEAQETTVIGSTSYSSNIVPQVVKNVSSIENIKNSGVISVDSSKLLNVSSLYKTSTEPSSKYILETRSPYVTRGALYGGEYFLTRVGFKENWDRIRILGDAYYENLLIEQTLTEKLGTSFINGLSGSALMKTLIDNSVVEKQNLGLQQGVSLTKERINNLKNDIIWYEYETVNGITALVPKVYLSQNTLNALNTNDKSKIYGTDYTLVNVDGTLENDNLQIGTDTSVTILTANEVKNNTGFIVGQQVRVEALEGNIENNGGSIVSADRLELVSKNGDVINNTLKETIKTGAGSYKVVSNTGLISAQDIMVSANLYNSTGAILTSDNLELNVNDVNLNTLELRGEDTYTADGRLQSYKATEHVSSAIETNSLNGIIENVNVNGSNLIAEDTTGLVVTGDVNISSEKNVYDTEYYTSDSGILSKESTYIKAHNEQNVVSNVKLGENAIILGDVNVVGSNVVLGEGTYVGGKLTTDSQALNNTYYEEHKKSGFSASISPTSISAGYGTSKTTYDEKALTNAQSNLVLGDNVTLNNGAEITATNLQHGTVEVNNGDVTFGARKDMVDIKQTSSSSFIGLTVNVNSPIVDRVKQTINAADRIKKGNYTSGALELANVYTGATVGFSENQGSQRAISQDQTQNAIKTGQGNEVSTEEADKARANNDFYIGVSANLGYSSTKTENKSHTESAVVSTIQGNDENSSITFNNQENVVFEGTQAKDTTLIYNNVENVRKEAVELNNSYSSSSKSVGVGVSASVSFGSDLNTGSKTDNTKEDKTKGNKVTTTIDLSAIGSSEKTNETLYQNGNFENVNEIHNNTGTMVLDGFNQEGGVVVGTVENLEVTSKQNTSKTDGYSYGVSVSIDPFNLANSSGNVNGSLTDGDREFADNQSSFVIGQGSNLVVGNATNTAGIIRTEVNAKMTIENYEGHNLSNSEELNTDGISVGTGGVGYDYSHHDKEGITRNTVVGNVEIGSSSGDEINRDLAKANEVTKDKTSEGDYYAESQLISAVLNPEDFKKKQELALQEIKDITDVISNSAKNQGADGRNFFELLNEQRRGTTINNIVGSDLKNLQEMYKNDEIDENQYKLGIKTIAETLGNDLGIDIEVRYVDNIRMPSKSKNQDGGAYEKNNENKIYINVENLYETSEVLSVMFEEVAHILDGTAGRQDTSETIQMSGESGLETLGRPIGDYFKEQYTDNSATIKLESDGIDYSKAEEDSNKLGDAVRFISLAYKNEGGGVIAIKGESAIGIAIGDNGETKFFTAKYKTYGLGGGVSTAISLDGGMVTGIDDPDDLKKIKYQGGMNVSVLGFNVKVDALIGNGAGGGSVGGGLSVGESGTIGFGKIEFKIYNSIEEFMRDDAIKMLNKSTRNKFYDFFKKRQEQQKRSKK